jgi:Zn-dependent protease/CBS domain-containing protein
MQGALMLFKVRGIPIRAHWTFLAILPLLAYIYGEQYAAFAQVAGIPPERLTWGPWVWGLVLAVALFASVLVHELAHSLYARGVGIRVRGITLLMIGGVSEIEEQPHRPGQEALMAFVGPVTSLVLGALLLLAAYGLQWLPALDLQLAVATLGEINLFLGLFNLLPAFPMDGGRILRALLTRPLGALRATQVAAGVGKVFAGLFAVTGLLGGNLLLVLIAFFVWVGANAEGEQADLRSLMADVRVRDLVGPVRASVDVNATAEEAVARMRDARVLALPVVDGADVLGVVSLEDLAAVEPDRRPLTAVRALTREVRPLAPDDEAWPALRRLATEGVAELPVVQDGQLVGTVDRDDVVRYLRFLRVTEGRARRVAMRHPITG